jgi:sulfur carrier protein
MPLTIHLNGTRHELDSPITVSELLHQLGFGAKPVLVELDENAIFPRDYDHTLVNDGAKVELVTLAAGG